MAPLPGCACYRRVYSLMRMALFSISYVDVSRVNLHTNMRFAQRSRAQKKCGRQVSAPWGRASKYGTDFVKNPGLCMPYFSREPAIICIFARLSTTKQKRKPRMRFPFLWCGRQELKTSSKCKISLFSRLIAFEHHNAHQEFFKFCYIVVLKTVH